MKALYVCAFGRVAAITVLTLAATAGMLLAADFYRATGVCVLFYQQRHGRQESVSHPTGRAPLAAVGRNDK
jgi:hypothetical protein